ncbi:hypothetical protein KOR42_45230 [Thalassoglobus neptunius]|uniref:Uncharacterized protein n=1 Tax=Thalassoglobus neptunius TaxID=1938619 RepID=A0A5C5VYM4_9PLAN|nr:hypothetical protein KOR42_45230 [Thalassoglobus neptunius]
MVRFARGVFDADGIAIDVYAHGTKNPFPRFGSRRRRLSHPESFLSSQVEGDMLMSKDDSALRVLL